MIPSSAPLTIKRPLLSNATLKIDETSFVLKSAWQKTVFMRSRLLNSRPSKALLRSPDGALPEAREEAIFPNLPRFPLS